jgi:hypothetical protein
MAEAASIPLTAIVVHSIPGRTRLRIPDRRHQPAYFAALTERLSAHPKVRRVTVNAHTASVLLQHEGTIEEIAAGFGDALQLALRPHAAAVRRAPRVLADPTAKRLVQSLALTCVALGAYQVRRGRLFGTAAENLWNAYNSWRNMRAPAVATALLGGGLLQLARGHMLSSAASLIYYAFNLQNLASGQGSTREKVP